jgi:hypothetical protein
MHSIFEGCDSLKSIDISNFNMIKCNNYTDMFTNVGNITYINIKNLQNDKTISNIFNKKTEAFYVCQSRIIICNLMTFQQVIAGEGMLSCL